MRASGTIMTYDTLEQRSVSLRPETQIADAVLQLGLLRVLATAFRAWWSRPRLPPNLPDSLRADVGLPPNEPMSHWHDQKYTVVNFDRYTR